MNEMPEMPTGPGLHLVLGPPNAGKLGFVLRWWIRQRAERPVIVVPSRADVAEVELELLERAGVVLDDSPVVSVDRLIFELRPPAVPLMGELRRSLLVRDVLAAELPTSPLGGLAGHPGGLDSLAGLLDELGESGLSADRIRAALVNWDEVGGGPLAGALGAVYDAYDRGLTAWGMVDRHQALAAAVEGCASWTRPVAFHGFLTFTPAQRALVLALAVRVPVVVTLAVDPERLAGGGPDEETAALRPAATSETRLPRQRLAYASPAVEHVEWAFLREGAEPWAGSSPEVPDGAHGPALEGVRFLLACGRRNEVELAAAEIVSLLRAGLRPGDIGVLVRRMEPWRGVVTDVFNRCGVPFSLDGTVAFAATGLGFALLSALRGLAEDDLGALLNFLRGPYHRLPVDEVDAAEVVVRGRAGGLGAADALERRLPGALAAVRAALRGSAGEVRGLDPAGVAALGAGMLDTAARGVSLGSEDFEQDARAIRTLVRSLGDIGSPESGPTDLEAPGRGLADRPLDTALSVLSGLPVSLGRGDEAGVVRVTTVRRARARRFPVVFVLGLVDTEFPGSERPPTLLGIREREALVDSEGVQILTSGRRSEDAALFALALSRPWQLLYLSARDAEDDGTEALPSPFWTEAARLLPGVPLGPRRGLEDVVHEPASAPTEREFLRACAALGLLPADPGRVRLLAGLTSWECRPTRLTHPAVLSALSVREVFSATELETYARCPFGWFAQRAVGLETMEEDLGPLHTGSVLHRVLRSVYAGLRDSGESRLTPVLLHRAAQMGEQALDSEVDGLRARWPEADLALMRAQLGDLLRVFLAFDANSRSALELFDLEVSLPSQGVDLGGFRLSGRIDRVECDPATGASVVIDYKSGSEVHGPDFAARGSLQVPLYALALRHVLLDTDVAGGLYVGLKGCVRRGAVLAEVADRAGEWVPSSARVDAETLEEELTLASTAARRAADGIRGGDIRAEPLKECPHFCDLSPLCRTPRKARSW